MNTRNKYKKLFLLIFLTFSLIGCDSALDPEKDGALTDKDIWENTTRAFGFLNNIYNNLPSGYNRIDGAMLASASDEAVHSNTKSNIYGFNDNRWSQYFLIENVWEKNYEGIRKVNMFLERIPNVPIKANTNNTVEQLEGTRERMIGEAHFLRALFYFELVKRYGGVPLTTKVLTAEEAQQMTRASIDDCIKQIVEDCKVAVTRLPVLYKAGGTTGFDDAGEKGRATQGAALALKARTLLYFASPLFNKSNDNSRWETAADAAAEVIKLSEDNSNLYKLIDFKSGENLGNIYYYVAGSSFGMYNADVIFSTSYSNTVAFEKSNTLSSFGGSGLTNPTQNLANAFGMADGTKNIDVNDPYKNRDPRFYMTFLYNGLNWSINDRTAVIETYLGGKDAVGKNENSTKTGYYLAKLMSKSAVWDGRTNNVNRTWVVMRYAETLLNYAEAKNESLAIPDESVYTTIEDIRKRAGLNPYTIARGKSKIEMREIIRNERQVELAFEEHRFFDVRRWRLFDDPVEKEKYLTVKGIEIEKQSDNSYTYSEFNVEKRVFEEKMYLYPIPENEIRKAKGITQNPGW